jgi:hypothetical protein
MCMRMANVISSQDTRAINGFICGMSFGVVFHVYEYTSFLRGTQVLFYLIHMKDFPAAEELPYGNTLVITSDECVYIM